MIRYAAFPGKALLNHPYLTAVIVPGREDPVGIWRIEKLRFLLQSCLESCFSPGEDGNCFPLYGMRSFTGTGLVADTGHDSTTTSPMSHELIKFMLNYNT